MEPIAAISVDPSFELDTTGVPEKALVVDDEATNRLVLRALLRQMNFQVVEAEDGTQALERFAEDNPDIVFMDIMMPGMDGYEITSRIKELCGDRFVPVIVLTAMNDEKALAKCITAGGDDVLTKPFDATLLKSKIHAMLRNRDLHRRISDLYDQMRYEEAVAERVFNQVVMANHVIPEGLQVLRRPAQVFSGDMVLSAYGPGGDLHVLLGDFTGHGLAAAIGALPTADIFRAMVAKGFDGRTVLAAINEKLCNVLPVEMFLAACYVHLPNDLKHATVFNCGLPDILVIDSDNHRVKQAVGSHHFSLGINPSFPSADALEKLALNLGDRLLLYSDGVIESRNPDGELFGSERLQRAIRSSDASASVFDNIVSSVDTFCREAPQDDDITLVEVPFLTTLLDSRKPRTRIVAESDELVSATHSEAHDCCRFSLTLQGERLRFIDPLPLVMNQLVEIKIPEAVRSEIFTVLSELFVNALDHGILKLDSALKQDLEGFGRYLSQRESRLNEVSNGSVTIELYVQWYRKGGRLVIVVEDSGDGFDSNAKGGVLQENKTPFGRGIGIVRELCQSLRYLPPGNKAEAVYVWTN